MHCGLVVISAVPARFARPYPAHFVSAVEKEILRPKENGEAMRSTIQRT
jgi:hypothetical protein